MGFLEPFVFIFAVFQLLRNKIAGPLLIMLCMYNSYNVIGEVQSFTLFPHHYTDDGFVLVLILMFVLSFRRIKTNINILGIKRGVFIFIVLLIIAVLIDICFNKMKLVTELRTFRGWICLPLIWFVKYIKPRETKLFLKYLLIFSIILATVLIIEHLFDVTISGAPRMSFGERAAIPWIPTFLVFILLICNYYTISTRIKWICVTIIIILLVLCGSRSLFIAYLAAFLITAFFKESRMTLKKIMLSILSIGLVIVVFSTDNILSRRFSEASDDFGGLQRTNAVVEGNFSFRILLLLERLDYINKEPQHMLFGIGFISETSLHRQLFKIGLKNEEGKIAQLDTADIAWAVLFLRYGYLGTFIYVLYVFIPFIRFYYKHRKRNVVAYSAMLYVFLNLVVISFTYSFIANSYFWLLPLMMLSLCGEDDTVKKTNHRLVSPDYTLKK